MSDRCPTVRQRPTVRQSDSSDSCPTVITCGSCHTPLRQLRQLRQGSDSSDSSPTALTAPLLGWLHLMGIPLVEVHPSRKVSFGKCSHQGVAHWHQYTLHGDPSHRGGSFLSLRFSASSLHHCLPECFPQEGRFFRSYRSISYLPFWSFCHGEGE